jgi:hypothetical protein
MKTRLRDGVRRVVPIAVAVLAFGVSYGVLARTAGLGAWAPVVMSATTFAGSAQFAAASILHTGGSVAAAGGDRQLVFDARLVGLVGAVVAIRLRAPVLVVVVLAAGLTAAARAL